MSTNAPMTANVSARFKYINSSVVEFNWNTKCSANLADYSLQKREYLFPVQFTIAIAGNLLTLAVLLSGSSNRANRLLTCLAICDCLLFVAMIIDSMITFEAFYVLPSVRILYYEYRDVTAFLTNWFAAASVWFVLAISVERLLIIKFPFRSLNNNQTRQVIIIATLIMMVTFCASQVHRFTNFCFTFPSCNGTEIKGACLPSYQPSDLNYVPEWLATIAPTWLIINSFLIVIIPIAIVIIINVSLLRIVKRSNKQELVRSSSTARPRRSDEQERSMTRAIIAIVTCFSVTQGPSGMLYLTVNMLTVTGTIQERDPVHTMLLNLTIYTNQLVLTGKMLNFVLFCLTSANFRVRLLNTMTMWCYKLGFIQRPVLNRKYIYASPTGTSTGCTEKPRVSFSRLPMDASRTLLTAKSSVASYHWKGRNGHDEPMVSMRNGHKKVSACSMSNNNNTAARVNANGTQRSSGSRSSQDSDATTTGNSRPLFMTANHLIEKEALFETSEM